MIASSLNSELCEFQNAFDAVFRPSIRSRMFGTDRSRHQGFSDGHEGVQWNAGVDRERGVITVGVNLEGMQYSGWPIARFIEAERNAPTFPTFATTYEHRDTAELWFSRDAWQADARFDILEQHFGQAPPVFLRDLSDALWRSMLSDAYNCLDDTRGHRGRARQIVTLSTGRREMAVSPHIQIKLVVRRTTSSSDLGKSFEIARKKLQPVRRILQGQASA